MTTYYDVTPFLVGRIHLHENKNIEEVCKGARIFRSFTCVLSNYLRDLKVRKLKVLCLFYYERLKWTICFQSEIFTVFEISTSCQNSQNETLHFVVKKVVFVFVQFLLVRILFMIQFQSSFNMIKFVLIPFKEIILVANIQSCIFKKPSRSIC